MTCKVGWPRRERLLTKPWGSWARGRSSPTPPRTYEDLNGNPVAMGSGAVFVGSTLDGQAQHGWPNQPTYGIRQVLGADLRPTATGSLLDQAGNTTGGDWRKVFSGNSTFKDNYAAGTAFIVIRRSDTQGPATHQARRSRHGCLRPDGHEQVGVDLARCARFRPAPGESGLDRHQHTAPCARATAGCQRHHRAVEPGRDVLRRASRPSTRPLSAISR